jgi:DNA-binding transcriptional regulator LsrR (DeoR family)
MSFWKQKETVEMDPKTYRLLAKLAKMYYEDDLTQKEIGNRLGLSRIKISRMLRLAKEQKVVQIVISPEGESHIDLEHELEARYNLAEVIIVSPTIYSQEIIREELGMAAAHCFLRSLNGNETVSITWGRNLSAMVAALTPARYPDLRVVQGLGGLSEPISDYDGVELVQRMAQTLGARGVILSAPGIVKHKETKDALLQERHIADVINMAANANIAIVGIGNPAPDTLMRANKIFTEEEFDWLLAKGSVGDIGLRFFDQDGIPIRGDINNRIIGLDLDKLRKIPRVIGIAGGPEKFEVIRAALRGNFINVLVTDINTAHRLLKEPECAKSA